MKFNSKKLKNIAIYSLCVMSIIQAIYSTISFAWSVNYYRSLGSSEALNSPILNSQFNNDDWNKWEMVCWGVYLSNFTQPFVDTYESAFNSGATSGSKGAGYRALVFGGASDAGSEETLKNLLNYAIGQQNSDWEKTIYVTFNELDSDGKLVKNDPPANAGAEAEDPNVSGIGADVNIRSAKVSDLFFAQSSSDGDTYANIGSDARGIFNSYDKTLDIGSGALNILMCNDASIPTFWVQTQNGGYAKIYDYSDGWDPQIFAANLIKSASGEYAEEMLKGIDEAYSNDYGLVMDCFGNICAKTNNGKRILIQAASNQHLTTDPSINLLTSSIFNGYMQSVNDNQLVNYSRQAGNGGFLGSGGGGGNIDVSGLPAFGGSDESISSGTVVCYYDIDSVFVQSSLYGGPAKDGDDVHYGKAIKALMDCDINNELGNEVPLKIETLNSVKIAQKIDPSGEYSWFSKSSTMLHTINIAGILPNQLENNGRKTKILSKIKDVDGTEYELFSSPALVPVHIATGNEISDKQDAKGATALRLLTKHLYKVYKEGVSNTYISANSKDLENAFNTKLPADFMEALTKTSDSKASNFAISFVTNYSGSLYDVSADTSTIKNYTTKFDDGTSIPMSMELKGSSGKVTAKFKMVSAFQKIAKAVTGAKKQPFFPGRVVLAYPVSEVMKAANNYLGLKEGSEYSAYASKIYMTYLDWYGVTGSGDDATSNFSTQIFDNRSDILKADITELVNAVSQEEKEKEILNMTYLMLHPTEGREYRTTLVKNNLADFLYSQYQSTVYGESVSYTSGNRTTTKSAGGFLNIETLSENFMTSAFLTKYIDIVATIIVTVLVLIIIIGLMKNRPLSWYVISFAIAINAILLTPASGDITPYLANKLMQSIFKNNMTFWSLSESIENAELESELNNDTDTGYLKGLTSDEKDQVLRLVKSLNNVNLDRSLMIKRDISSKVTQELNGNYEEIQSSRSARWLLPMIMRQYTANDGSSDYVFAPIGDIYDDLSNMYWYYRPLDAETANTMTSAQAGVSIDDVTKNILTSKSSYPGRKDISVYDGDINYKNESYNIATSTDDIEHNYMYVIADNRLHATSLETYLDSNDGYQDLSSLDGYSQYCINSDPSIVSTLTDLVKQIEEKASSYDRTDRGTIDQIFGYLWTTENPYHYFYGVVKDSFDMTDSMNQELTMASIIGKIQGSYVINEDGEEVRTNFMYANETGYIKDVLDLEDLFTNCIPYLYQMQLLAGGDNGKGGALEGITISDNFSLYEGSDASWLFRCNWVTKLVENPSYGNPEKVRDSDGNDYIVNNPMLYFTYPDDRPMVFSEAQMHAQNLKESDLTVTELKCIEINKAVARRWTLLLNYANTSGLTKEVLLRQMATEAILEFDSQMSPTSVLNGAYAMYPNSIDLRALSFDSVMRMLLLNITKNTSYIHSDTMLNVISNLDLFAAVLLWIAAELCSWFIPLCRQILMGSIFYLGLLSTVYSLFSSNMDKAKRACGQVLINIAFLAVTCLYYLFFKLLMGMTATDSVLTVDSVQVDMGNPIWCFVLIIVVSIIYIIIMIHMFRFCFLNFRDMGFEVISAMASIATDKIQGTIDSAVTGVQSFFSSDDGSPSSGGNMKGTGKSKSQAQDVNIKESSQTQDVNIIHDEDKEVLNEEYRTANYYDGASDSSDSSKFDEEIEKGRNMRD